MLCHKKGLCVIPTKREKTHKPVKIKYEVI